MTPAPRWFRRPPDCRRVVGVLQAYLDGELLDEEHHLVADHLRHCSRCGIEARVYHDIKRSLRGLAAPKNGQAVQRLRAYADDLPRGDVDRGR